MKIRKIKKELCRLRNEVDSLLNIFEEQDHIIHNLTLQVNILIEQIVKLQNAPFIIQAPSEPLPHIEKPQTDKTYQVWCQVL